MPVKSVLPFTHEASVPTGWCLAARLLKNSSTGVHHIRIWTGDLSAPVGSALGERWSTSPGHHLSSFTTQFHSPVDSLHASSSATRPLREAVPCGSTFCVGFAMKPNSKKTTGLLQKDLR
jgi:hypothetical protein